MKKATRQQYASAAKARRQKQILAVLGVVLVGVLVIQGPKTLKLLNGSGSTPAATTSATSGTQPSSSAAPATAIPATGLPGAALAASPSGIADASPPRSPSQLYSFEVFASKDPFVQQVSTTPTVTAPAPAPSASAPSPTPTVPAPAPTAPPSKKATTPASTTPAAATAVSSTYATTPAQAVAAVTPTGGTAVIAVNGESDPVAAGQAFPAANPTFRLVSIQAGTALIGLVGGAYASGTPTVTLVPGHTLTLVDTTDGVRYELRLVAVSG
jgi:hypothetical protein